VVVWETASATAVRLHGRLFDARLRPLTSDLPIDEGGEPGQSSAEVTSNPSGGFIVRWSSDAAPARRERRFDAEASALGPTTSVREISPTESCFEEAQRSNGQTLQVWVEDCASLGRIYARGATTIFADGFEVGDTSLWSLRVPQAALAFVSPTPGACLNASFQSLSLTFTDPAGNGLDPQSFLLSANGGGVPTSCSFGAGTISCDLQGALPEGSVALLATVDDAEGHPAIPTQVSVDVDTTAPEAIATGPGHRRTGWIGCGQCRQQRRRG